MCEECHNEADDDYEGGSIQAKRLKAIRSIVNRHPELGLEPEDIILRYTPKTEHKCIRVNIHAPDDEPTYEIHYPRGMSRMVASSPPLRGIAKASWIASDKSFEDICEILDVQFSLKYDAIFVSEEPPIYAHRADNGASVHEYERSIEESLNAETE